jgi:hypothetical protein
VSSSSVAEISLLSPSPSFSTRPVAPESPPSSRPGTPIEEAEAFDPSTADLSPSNSAILSTERLPGYLEKALKALGLHTEARTSFISYVGLATADFIDTVLMIVNSSQILAAIFPAPFVCGFPFCLSGIVRACGTS